MFYADPFLTCQAGQLYVAAEKYDFKKRKGFIVVFPLGEKNRRGKEEVALDFPFHTSYPCLVEENSRLYCIPETLACEEIGIYRCEKFPRIWNKAAVVATGHRFSDPTCFKYEGRWWIFGTLFDQHSEGNSLLYAWYADDITGPWLPHLKNPIKCDVSSSRSAGTPYRFQDGFFRPAQDCSRTYGNSIVINRITKLSPTEFSEEYYRRVRADANYPDACHHLAKWGSLTLVDGRRDHFSFSAAATNLVRLKNLVQSRFTLPATQAPPLSSLWHELEFGEPIGR